MPILTKSQLEELNQSSFPDNTSGSITPLILRTYNTATIDTLVDSLDTGSFIQDLTSLNSFTQSQLEKDSTLGTYTGSVNLQLGNLTTSQSNDNQKWNTLGSQSGSWVNESETGSFLVDASFNNSTRNLTFLRGDSVLFNVNIPDATGSVIPSGVVSGSSQIDYPLISNIPTGIVSGSSQVILQSTTGNLSGSRIDGSVATSVSASHAVIADSALTSITAQDIIVNAKNTSGAIIPKGSAVRITGATGDNPEIGLADWTNDSSSANTLGITSEAVAINGFTNVITQGRIIGLSTQAFTAGQLIFLGPNGTIVASVPTPYHEVRLGQVLRSQNNNGSIYVSIDNGYELTELHDVNIVTASLANNQLLAYDSASLQWTNKSINGLGIPQLSANNTFTGTLNQFQNISAVSASFQHVTTVSGSAVIIGDSFVVVNNDTPTAPYGGLSVYDSGSGLPTTSSLVWDGNTNDWKYSYDVGNGHDAAVMLFGPDATGLANTPYPTNNKLQKGKGTHHLGDSSIYDDGTTVAVGANLSVTGSISTNGNSVLTATDLVPLNSFTASQEITNTALNAFTQSQQVLNATYATTGSNTFVATQRISNGGIEITGSISTNNTSISGTSNLDASLGNTFVWSLTDGVANTLSISNNKVGQTINVLVQQGALGTGTAAFSAAFLQPSGSTYSATQVANAVDILTLATFGNTSKVYVASVKNLI